MLPCAIDEATIAAERVRITFANAGVQVDETPLATSVSIGLASGRPGASLNALLAAADTALYRAKRGGRNRLEIATDEPVALDQQTPNATIPPKQPVIVHQLENVGV